jgi:hypothetical protein
MEQLPETIQRSIHALSSDISAVAKERAMALLRRCVEGKVDLSDLLLFEDDGDLVLHWNDHAIYCEWMEDQNKYRANKVVHHEGQFVSNAVFLSSVEDLLDWLRENLKE